ncbi:Type II secretion system protein G precursor [Planctomycetes bacterium Poly30]|uniref:Type II secretion system protein G n=1 Tax=Saltatorellus ferox TaxID=2528018 RepID=A0A518EQS3_9BACT|nr:Type II secretion system protein G precursor [Planctomycetes bacterium Poly30]
MRPTPLNTRHRQDGFTLVELVTVVTILTILVGLAVPRVSGTIEKGRIARAASDMKAIKRAVQMMQEDLGRYPTTTNNGVDPGLINSAQVPSSIRANWKGPYLEVWPGENPWGGDYDYGQGNIPEFNYDGTAGNECVVSLIGLDQATATAIDSIIDDGNTSTGMALFRGGGGWYSLYVGEGRIW